MRLPRLLLGLAALLLFFGCVVHAMAFSKVVAAVAASNLPAFFGNSLKLFWLADSLSMFILALVFSLCVWRPASASKPVIVLLALIPGSTGVLLYVFLGTFIATPLTLAIAILALLAGLKWPNPTLESVS
jgi:hypothetical protein